MSERRPPAHRWHECQPALVARAEATPEEIRCAAAAIERVWAGLSSVERATFHRATCLGRDDPFHLAAVGRIADLVKQEMAR